MDKSLKRWMIVLICLCGCSSSNQIEEKTPEQKISFHRGYSLWKEQLTYATKIPYDIHQVIQGILAADRREDCPLSNEEISILSLKFKEEVLKRTEEKNLLRAESFLKSIKDELGIKELIPGKLYFKVKKPGQGQSLSQNDLPFFTFSIRTLDGEIYSCEEEVQICLSDTIPGFTQGIIGMQEGEERVLYIHPDLAYGNSTCKLAPNSLVIIEASMVRISS